MSINQFYFLKMMFVLFFIVYVIFVKQGIKNTHFLSFLSPSFFLFFLSLISLSYFIYSKI